VKIWRIFLAAVIFTVISEIINMAGSFLTMNFYTDSNYFAVWSKIMMPAAGPPPSSFYYYSIAFTFISGLIFSFIFSKVKDVKIDSLIKANVWWKNGTRYGIAVWLLASIPWTFTTYLLINLPSMLLVYWAISGLLVYILSGIAIAKILK
jgi:hypothetical protein